MSKQRRRFDLKKLGNIGLVVLALMTAGIVGMLLLKPAPAPAVSQKVIDYYTAPPTQKPAPKLVTIIGDSYTGGSDMGGLKAANWVARAQTTMENTNLDNKGIGGTGYATDASKNFGSRIATSIGPSTSLVVFVGSRNDIDNAPAAVQSAAKAAYADVKKIAPKAKLLVIGPVWGGSDVPARMLKVRDAVHAAATEAGATWVDPIEQGWFLVPEQQAMIGADGVHPTDEGHAFLATTIAPLIKSSLG